MDSGILEAIDREIAQLQEARALLSGHANAAQKSGTACESCIASGEPRGDAR
jgi:hypothetical protein